MGVTDLPTGTVTFLFTDIEGSTRLMQELGDRYVQAQLAHHEILRKAFNSGDGRELRTEGDSFFCVFKSARDACSAAANAQRDLASHAWPDNKAIRVRIGLHAGEAPLVGGEYIGLDVHHAARIAASAHGGQVVVSDAIRSLVEANLPPELGLRDLGLHRLKDLARPERLFQLVIEGAPNTFPALRTIDSTPNNLPTQLTSFVGREDLVATAERLLEGNRLLTLTGPGGIGKTRLSLQIAADVVQKFHHGVYFVPLSAVSNPGLVASIIAHAIGIPVPGNRLPYDAVVDYLSDKRVLLVLDNFEQLLPEGAPFVSDLLRAVPDLKCVVSSRAVLRVYGEQELAVEPLRTPDLKSVTSVSALSQFDAVKLFIERALTARYDFQVTNDNAPAIAGICERLDGLPLAIELAAARVKLFTPQALLDRLGSGFSILGTGARDLPSRQQTLQGAIAWSYDLLDEPLKRLFRRSSVFARGANLEQAEAVCGPMQELGVDVLTGLDDLAAQSLLRRIPDLEEPRLLMLQVIREFAAERLAVSGEADDIKQRHAAAYQALADAAAPNLFGADQKKWLDRLELDVDNFRSAFDWSVERGDASRALRLGSAFWRFWQMRGHLREGRMRLDNILAMPTTRDHQLDRARTLEAAGGVAYWQGDLDAAQTYYDESLALWRAGGDQAAIANALYNASFPRNVPRTDLAKGRDLLGEALAIYRGLGDESGIARCLWALGQIDYYLEDFAPAVAAIDEAIRLFRQQDDRFGLGWALFVRASIGIKVNDIPAARSRNLEALRIFAAAQDVSGAVLVLNGLAEVARHEGDSVRAARLAGASAGQESSSGAGLGTVVGAVEGWRSREDLSEAEMAAYAEGKAMTLEQAIANALAGEDRAVELGA